MPLQRSVSVFFAFSTVALGVLIVSCSEPSRFTIYRGNCANAIARHPVDSPGR